MAIEIRPAHIWADYLQCEEIQREVWQAPNNRDVVPAALLITAHKNGGVLLGAFEGDRMIGFVFGFMGMEQHHGSRLFKHCSHMLAVLPPYRAQGLGPELKKRQREELIRQGLTLSTWTYDPLQALNASLNLNRLGAIARRYICDAYGEMLDVLNAGVSSDRFEAEWWLDSTRVRAAMTEQARSKQDLPPGIPAVHQVVFDDRGLPKIVSEAGLSGETCLVEFPADFNRLKGVDLPLARAWRAATRSTFQAAFAEGFVAVSAPIWRDPAGRPRVGYLLTRNQAIFS